jgi:hypothetical protein
MRTTLDLNQDLILQAQALTHIKEKTALIHEALRALIAQAASKELALMSGTQKKIKPISRKPVR